MANIPLSTLVERSNAAQVYLPFGEYIISTSLSQVFDPYTKTLLSYDAIHICVNVIAKEHYRPKQPSLCSAITVFRSRNN